jgi:hypothetical protein
MKTILMTAMALSLSSCGSESSTFDKFADARWAKSPENCKTEFTTFDERSIRFHSPGGVVEFGKIVKIGDASPTIAALTVEPSPIIKEAARKSQNPLLSEAVTMGFELNGERLRLRGLVGGPRSQLGGELRSDTAEYQLFDLTRC